MSNTFCYLAARCGLAELEASFFEAWPSFEIAEPPVEFETYDAAYEWASPRSGYLRGTHPEDVKMIFTDGGWSVMADFSLCMPSDNESLAVLSRRTGRVVIATTQGTAGFAQLLVLDAGTMTRSITRADSQIETEGRALAEEEGIALARFSFEDLDRVWRRFGLSSFLEKEPTGPIRLLHVIDRTVYPAPAARPPASQKPWWKIW
jgi:hypothetical protein